MGLRNLPGAPQEPPTRARGEVAAGKEEPPRHPPGTSPPRPPGGPPRPRAASTDSVEARPTVGATFAQRLARVNITLRTFGTSQYHAPNVWHESISRSERLARVNATLRTFGTSQCHAPSVWHESMPRSERLARVNATLRAFGTSQYHAPNLSISRCCCCCCCAVLRCAALCCGVLRCQDHVRATFETSQCHALDVSN